VQQPNAIAVSVVVGMIVVIISGTNKGGVWGIAVVYLACGHNIFIHLAVKMSLHVW
jgi:hypothetical protein